MSPPSTRFKRLDATEGVFKGGEDRARDLVARPAERQVAARARGRLAALRRRLEALQDERAGQRDRDA